MIEESIQNILAIENGFKLIESEAGRISAALSPSSILPLAQELLRHDAFQVRSLALFLLGNIASVEPGALELVREQARNDENWRVQEIAAKAFDHYCHDTGYEAALPRIEDWLNDPHPNVCRAVTEGLRIWTGRPYFNTHPEEAIRLISRHRNSGSEYLCRSVGNALRDIGKKFPGLIQQEISGWNVDNSTEAFTYRFVIKKK